MTLSEVQVKCPVILICPLGDGIEVDLLMRGQVGGGCLVVVLVGREESRYRLTDPSSFWPVYKPSMVVVKK